MTKRHPVSPHTRLGRPVIGHDRSNPGASSASASEPKSGAQARASAVAAATAESQGSTATSVLKSGYPLGSDYVECPDCGVTEWSDRASVGDPCSRKFPGPCEGKFGSALSPGESDYADELLEHLIELNGSDACLTEWHPDGGMHEATASVKRVKMILGSAGAAHEDGTPIEDIESFLLEAQTGSWMDRQACRVAWPGEFTVARKLLENESLDRDLTSSDVEAMETRLEAVIEVQEQALRQRDNAKRWWADTYDGDIDAFRAGVSECRNRMLGEVPLVDGNEHADLMMQRASEIIFAAAMEDFGAGNELETNHEWRNRELTHREVQERATAACTAIEEGIAEPTLRDARDMVRIWVNQWPEPVTPASMHQLGCLLAEDRRLRAKAVKLTGAG